MQLFDPRQHDQHVIKGDRRDVSVDRDNVLVIHSASVDWERYSQSVDDVFSATSERGFVIYIPWAPGTSRKITTFDTFYGGRTDIVGGNPLAIVTDGDHYCSRALELRRSLGGSNSGLWIVGVSAQPEVLETRLRAEAVLSNPPLTVTADVFDTMVAALCLDEGGRSSFLVRLTQNSEKAVNALLALLPAPSNQEHDW